MSRRTTDFIAENPRVALMIGGLIRQVQVSSGFAYHWSFYQLENLSFQSPQALESCHMHGRCSRFARRRQLATTALQGDFIGLLYWVPFGGWRAMKDLRVILEVGAVITPLPALPDPPSPEPPSPEPRDGFKRGLRMFGVLLLGSAAGWCGCLTFMDVRYPKAGSIGNAEPRSPAFAPPRVALSEPFRPVFDADADLREQERQEKLRIKKAAILVTTRALWTDSAGKGVTYRSGPLPAEASWDSERRGFYAGQLDVGRYYCDSDGSIWQYLGGRAVDTSAWRGLIVKGKVASHFSVGVGAD